MTALLLSLAVLVLVVPAVRSIIRGRRVIDDATQWQKARAATTPEDWRPL